jgi:pilus assembly protein Flp/PilA
VRALASTARKFLLDEHAVTSIEYALVGVLIAVACAFTVSAVGTEVGALYQNVCNRVTEAISGVPAC